jgi:hypothetical protein
MPPAAPRGARRNIGEYQNAPELDRMEGTITATTFRDPNPFCISSAAGGRPFAVHVHESVRPQLVALTHTLLAG